MRLVETTAKQSETGDDGRAWQALANCLGVDPDLFFPERGASTREAKEVCRACVVREECFGVRHRERREVRHLGRHERAGATPGPPGSGTHPSARAGDRGGRQFRRLSYSR